MKNMLNVLKAAIWGNSIPEEFVTWDTYEKLKKHTVSVLPANILGKLFMSNDLRDEWEKDVYRHVSYYFNYKYHEERIPVTTPFVILKGSAAAQYYTLPEYRQMGDVDIMTAHENFNKAYEQLLNNGYIAVKTTDRETRFSKNGHIIELHRYFSLLSDPNKAEYLDKLIIENILPSHFLPDLVNGLVLLEHIDQHMEGGIGLRQIIDWMLFVHRCLPDERWPEFREMAQNIGLEQLAIVTTKMCVSYLGLSQRNWCKSADDSLCDQLMDYIMSCGNFGNMKNDDESISENAFTFARSPKSAIYLLQRRGIVNWKLYQRHKWLKPCAWIYQLFRYLCRGIKREKAGNKLKNEILAAKARNKMFTALGIKRISDGHTVYKNGAYVNESFFRRL